MITETNVMGVPEISCYPRQEIEGGVIIRYLVRQPGERDWTPVKIVRLTEAESHTVPTYRSSTLGRVTIPD